MNYLATFPAGTFPVISRHLKSFNVDQLKFVGHDESSVFFESTLTTEKLIEMRYFTNVYLIIDPDAKPHFNGKYFKLTFLKNGLPEPMNYSVKKVLEQKIADDFKLTPDTHLATNLFYLIERNNKKYLTLKLPRAKFKREKLSAGELRPEIAHILCLAAGLKAKHKLLDMFAGYGAIPQEAVRGFGCRQVIAVDNQKLPGRHEADQIEWHTADACNLDFMGSGSIDRVITDPPWGLYDKVSSIADLYEETGAEIFRVLKNNSTAVVLSGYDQAEDYLTKKLKLIDKWNILISGKKAVIYKLQKEEK